jgi:hypothetical protein
MESPSVLGGPQMLDFTVPPSLLTIGDEELADEVIE